MVKVWKHGHALDVAAVLSFPALPSCRLGEFASGKPACSSLPGGLQEAEGRAVTVLSHIQGSPPRAAGSALHGKLGSTVDTRSTPDEKAKAGLRRRASSVTLNVWETTVPSGTR